MFTSADRILITGATGWVGRSLLDEILQSRSIADPLLVASSKKRFHFRGRHWETQTFSDLNDSQLKDVKYIFHAAFLRRDSNQEIQQFMQINSSITSSVLQTASKCRQLQSIVNVSSGAAKEFSGGNLKDARDDVYGYLKHASEIELRTFCADNNVKFLNSRLFSLSGFHITNPKAFALGDFILQGLGSSQIYVRSKKLVYRNYIDAQDYAKVLLKGLQNGESGNFDSCGFSVEVRELAHLVATELSKKLDKAITVNSDLPSETPDSYLPEEVSIFKKIVSDSGINLLSIEDQISRTVNGIINA
jgi:nucleoside-diphosphate-sugar epimerase